MALPYFWRPLAASLALLGGSLRLLAAPDTLVITQGPESTLAYGDAANEWLPFLSYVNHTAFVTFSEHSDSVIFPTVDAMRVSFDGGVTWPTYVQHENFYCSSVIRRGDGSLMATSYITQKADPLTVTGYHWISNDGGRTWSPRTSSLVVPKNQPNRAANWGGFLFHRTLITMPDGSIQGTMYGQWSGDTRSRVIWVKSTDGGATWVLVSVVAYNPTIGSEGFDEPVGIVAADGSLLVVMRIGSGAPYPLYQTRSTDGGLTWSTPITLPGVDPASTYSVDPDLTMMANGTLVLAYGRPSTNLLFSLDGSGYSWGYLTTPIFAASTKNYLGVREVAPDKLLIVADLNNSLIQKYVTVTRHSAPAITAQPASSKIATGSTVIFTAAASGSPAPSYQWTFNGAPLNGATSARLVLSSAGLVNAGPYACTASNDSGTATSLDAQLTVTEQANPGRLINLSVLSLVPSSLTMGFVIGGAGTAGSKSLLIRASGPTLAQPPFNVPGTMADPALTVFRQSDASTVAANAAWGTSADPGQLTSVASAVGAFAFSSPDSFDSAVVAALPGVVGGYSAKVASKTSGSGYALTEVYDATPAGTYTPATPRLVNLSCLTQVAPGGTLTTGFVIGGSTAKTVLVRASGPTLAAAPFGLGGTMADPQLTVQPLSSPGTVLAANAGWGGDAQLASIAASVGAFAFAAPDSKDSATALTLPEGVPYTVQVSSTSGAGGWVLVEIFEVP